MEVCAMCVRCAVGGLFHISCLSSPLLPGRRLRPGDWSRGHGDHLWRGRLERHQRCGGRLLRCDEGGVGGRGEQNVAPILLLLLSACLIVDCCPSLLVRSPVRRPRCRGPSCHLHRRRAAVVHLGEPQGAASHAREGWQPGFREELLRRGGRPALPGLLLLCSRAATRCSMLTYLSCMEFASAGDLPPGTPRLSRRGLCGGWCGGRPSLRSRPASHPDYESPTPARTKGLLPVLPPLPVPSPGRRLRSGSCRPPTPRSARPSSLPSTTASPCTSACPATLRLQCTLRLRLSRSPFTSPRQCRALVRLLTCPKQLTVITFVATCPPLSAHKKAS